MPSGLRWPGSSTRASKVKRESTIRSTTKLAQLQLRLPLIPGVNDDADNIERTGRFAASLPGVRDIDVLPYHSAARSKYAKLGLPYPGDHIPPSDPQSVSRAVSLLQNCGLSVRIGG